MLLKAFVPKTWEFFKNMCEKYVFFCFMRDRNWGQPWLSFSFVKVTFFNLKSKSNFELRFTMCDFKYEYKGLDLSLESTLEDLTA